MAEAIDPVLKPLLRKGAQIVATGSDDERVRMVGTADQLAAFIGDRWVVLGWHEVERGAWRAQTQRFEWFDLNGRSYLVDLTDPGAMPMLFIERIQASTLMTQHLNLECGEVRIVVRRGLDGSDKLRFFAVPSGGARIDDPITARLIVEETDRIKAEYGLS